MFEGWRTMTVPNYFSSTPFFTIYGHSGYSMNDFFLPINHSFNLLIIPLLLFLIALFCFVPLETYEVFNSYIFDKGNSLLNNYL